MLDVAELAELEQPDVETPAADPAAAGEPWPRTVLDEAAAYARKGWRVVPVPHRGKNPGDAYGPGWQKARLAEVDLPAHFPPGRPMNVGVLLGEPSGGLTDADLDSPEAVLLAPAFLPDTSCRFGRAG